MDFQDFGIDSRLAAAIRDCGTSPFFFDKILSRSLKGGENVCAKITLGAGREEVILLPALQWLLSAREGGRRKILVVASDSEGAGKMAETARRIGGGAGLDACVIAASESEGDEPASASVSGDPAAQIVAGGPEALLAASAQGLVNLRDYGFLIVDGADRLAERPSDLMRKLAGSLLPTWERRTILACSRITVKAKNLAWDISDNPCEISIEGEVAKAQSVAKETWRVASDSKLRFLLGYIASAKPSRFCVFCNLRDTAEELAKRLEINGIASDYLLGALAVERKLAVLEKVESGRCAALILTDKGAEGLPQGRFPLVVNYDLPLEPEYFVKRLEMLDRAADGAKVTSIACDRYIYGLSAVESYIDAKLDATDADESLMAPEDKSAGMTMDPRSAARDDRPRDDRPRDDRPRDDRPRDDRGRQERREPGYGGREDRARRDGGRRDVRREDRGPDIRRSISEATGGSLDVGGETAPERPRERGRPEGGKQTSGQRQGGSRDDRREDRSRGPEPRGARDNRSPNRGDKSNRGDRSNHGDRAPSRERDRGRTGERSSTNPYELPMEERMKRYREKYGQRVAGASRRNPPQGQGQPQFRADSGSAGASGERATSKSALPGDGATGDRGGDGLLGKLFGPFRRKTE
jgi:ATP-dependent RNA helicase RhlB